MGAVFDHYPCPLAVIFQLLPVLWESRLLWFVEISILCNAAVRENRITELDPLCEVCRADSWGERRSARPTHIL